MVIDTQLLDHASEDICICGHEWGDHNDITKLCCWTVVVGRLSAEDDNLAMVRVCALCPPTTGFIDATHTYPGTWPEPDFIIAPESGVYS